MNNRISKDVVGLSNMRNDPLDELVIPSVLAFVFGVGMLLVKYPMMMLRRTVSKRQWQQLEREDPPSIAAVVRLIGICWMVGVVLVLLLMYAA